MLNEVQKIEYNEILKSVPKEKINMIKLTKLH